MSIVRWDPFRDLEEVTARLNRLFGQPMPRRAAEEEGTLLADWVPALDVQETDNEYLVKMDLPDVKKDDVRVEVQNGTLSVEGERRQEKEEKGRRFHRVERSYGRFERRLTLPAEVDAQKVKAEFKDGVLNVHLPRSAAARPKAIEVKVS